VTQDVIGKDLLGIGERSGFRNARIREGRSSGLLERVKYTVKEKKNQQADRRRGGNRNGATLQVGQEVKSRSPTLPGE